MPLVGGARLPSDKSKHLLTVRDQTPHERGSDQTGRPGDDNPHVTQYLVILDA